ncbi:MAG: hypothetical protein N2170_09545 [Bacteroidia bacterium]|nr:hypothetical protein [Bacteroidia bacterium]
MCFCYWQLHLCWGGGYTCGGPFALSYRYNPITDTWTSIAPLPSPRHGAVGVSDGQYGYVLGGWSGNSNTTTLFRYDPSTNSWTSLTSYPTRIWIPFLTYQNNSLYAGLGRSFSCENSFYRYDISSNSWSSLNAHIRSGYDGWAVSIPDLIIVTGEHPNCNPNDCSDQFYRYNFSSNTWSPISPFLGGGRNNLIGGVVEGRYFTGMGAACSVPVVDWWMYCP